jgi:hypothetical protein
VRARVGRKEGRKAGANDARKTRLSFGSAGVEGRLGRCDPFRLKGARGQVQS